MKLNSRTVLNLVLVLAVLALAALLYFQPGLKEEAAPLLTGLDPAQVKELRLSNGQGELLLRREGAEWRLQQPLAIAANTFRVEQLLRWLSYPSVQSYDAAGLDLARFGLEQPEALLAADGVELRFGALDPLNQRRYLLLDGKIHLVAESGLTAPAAPWNYFVSAAVVPPGGRIKEIAIPALGELIQGEAGWRYSGRMPPPSADLMQQLVDGWSSAQALSVEPAAAAVAHEQVVITFADARPPLRLMLRRGDDLVLAPEGLGIEYHMGEQGARLLQWPEPAAAEVR